MKIRKMRATRNTWALVAFSSILFFPTAKVSGDNMARLSGHFLPRKIQDAKALGPTDSLEPMKLAVVLKPRNQAGLDDFLKRVYDPADPLFHHFLTTQEYNDRFGPTEDDIRSVTRHLERHGMRITNVSSHVVEAEGAASNAESAFEIQLHNYRLKNGRMARAANQNPAIPGEFASRVSVIAGLNTLTVRTPHVKKSRALQPREISQHAAIDDFMTPSNIKKTYNLESVPKTGAGESVALFELDGYTPSDITGYASHFGITAPTLQNVLVNGATGTPGDGAIEVTLDIQLVAALAPGLSKIIVYEGPNTDSGVIATYNKIATDNAAAQVSISWGASEDESPGSIIAAENTIFQQMAAQGQSVYAASGDNGAYDNQRSNFDSLVVDDPASQPYVTGVGGTKVFWTAAGAYKSESAWGTPSDATGGGGGLSKIWSAPSYQQKIKTNNIDGIYSGMRHVPDVALDADPDTGYAVMFQGSWVKVGGTSCGAPLWAAFNALVNEKRVGDGLSRLGFANPKLYQIGESSNYQSAFHDIRDYSRNLHYYASEDYDVATGWGSFNGLGLYTTLVGATLPSSQASPGMPGNFQGSAP